MVSDGVPRTKPNEMFDLLSEKLMPDHYGSFSNLKFETRVLISRHAYCIASLPAAKVQGISCKNQLIFLSTHRIVCVGFYPIASIQYSMPSLVVDGRFLMCGLAAVSLLFVKPNLCLKICKKFEISSMCPGLIKLTYIMV